MGFEKIINELEKKKVAEYNPVIYSNTKYYQKKYGFELNPRKGHDTWNVEADGFKHVFGSALISLRENNILSFGYGRYHEFKNKNNPKDEEQMDLENNKVGRSIANEIKRECKNWKNLSERQQYDIIAAKTWKKMNEGKVILDPSGRTKLKNPPDKNVYKEQIKVLSKYEKNNKNHPTGYAANIDDNVVKLENRVFHNEEINPAKSDDKKVVNQVLKQYFENGNKMPTETELKEQVISGDLIFVDNYTRSDGTKVSGYYRTH